MSDKSRRSHCFIDVEIAGNTAGRIVVELFSDVCPKTCINFIKLCNGEKINDEFVCYKRLPFRAITNAVKVECTCSSEAVREELRSRTYPGEVSVLKHFKELLLSAANRGSDADGLHWIITTASTPELDSTHLVFGRVVSGQGVIEQIYATAQNDRGQGSSLPVRIGNCGELKSRVQDQRKPPLLYRSTANQYTSPETSDNSNSSWSQKLWEDNQAKTLTLASLFKRSNKLSRGVTSSGDRKIRGRGTVRYRASSSKSRSESETPPHWRTELEKVKPFERDLEEVPKDRWIKGDKLVNSESSGRRSDRYSRRELDSHSEDTSRISRKSGRRWQHYEYESDREGTRRSKRKSKRYHDESEGDSIEISRKSRKYSQRYDENNEDYVRHHDYDENSEKHYSDTSESDRDKNLKSRKKVKKHLQTARHKNDEKSPKRYSKKNIRQYSSSDELESGELCDKSPKREFSLKKKHENEKKAKVGTESFYLSTEDSDSGREDDNRRSSKRPDSLPVKHHKKKKGSRKSQNLKTKKVIKKQSAKNYSGSSQEPCLENQYQHGKTSRITAESGEQFRSKKTKHHKTKAASKTVSCQTEFGISTFDPEHSINKVYAISNASEDVRNVSYCLRSPTVKSKNLRDMQKYLSSSDLSDSEFTARRPSQKKDEVSKTEFSRQTVSTQNELQVSHSKTKHSADQILNCSNSEKRDENAVVRMLQSKPDRQIVSPSSEELKDGTRDQPPKKKAKGDSDFDGGAPISKTTRKIGHELMSKIGPDRRGSGSVIGLEKQKSYVKMSTSRSGSSEKSFITKESRNALQMTCELECENNVVSAGGDRVKRNILLTDDQDMDKMTKVKEHQFEKSPKLYRISKETVLKSSQKCNSKTKSSLKQSREHMVSVREQRESLSSESGDHDLNRSSRSLSSKRSQIWSHERKSASSSSYLSYHSKNRHKRFWSDSPSSSSSSSYSSLSTDKVRRHRRLSQSNKHYYSSRSRSSEFVKNKRRHSYLSVNSSSRSGSISRSRASSVERSRSARQQPLSHYAAEQKEAGITGTAAGTTSKVLTKLPVQVSGSSLNAIIENLSDSPPPSRWKPGQKPWKPKKMLLTSDRGLIKEQFGNTFASSTGPSQRPESAFGDMHGSGKASEYSNETHQELHGNSHKHHRKRSSGSDSSDKEDMQSEYSRSRKSGSHRSKSRSNRSRSSGSPGKQWSLSSTNRSRTDKSRSGSSNSIVRSKWSRHKPRQRVDGSSSSHSRSGSSRSGSVECLITDKLTPSRLSLQPAYIASQQDCIPSAPPGRGSESCSIMHRVKPGKRREKKVVSQMFHWEPPVEPDYVSGATEDEDSNLEDLSRLVTRRHRKQKRKNNTSVEEVQGKTEAEEQTNGKEKTEDGSSLEKADKEGLTGSVNDAKPTTVSATAIELQSDGKAQPEKELEIISCVDVGETTESSQEKVLCGMQEEDVVCSAEERKGFGFSTASDVDDVKVEVPANTDHVSAEDRAEDHVINERDLSTEDDLGVKVMAEEKTACVESDNVVVVVIEEEQLGSSKSADASKSLEINGLNSANPAADVDAETQRVDVKDVDVKKEVKVIDLEIENHTACNKTAYLPESACTDKTQDFTDSKQTTDESTLYRSQTNTKQHQSRSGPSKLPKFNFQDNRLLGKQLNFTWKSRSRLPVSGSVGVIKLDSPLSPPESPFSHKALPEMPVDSREEHNDTSTCVVGSPKNDTEMVVQQQDLTEQNLETSKLNRGRKSRLKSVESSRRSSSQSSPSSGNSSSRSSSKSSEVYISSNSEDEEKRLSRSRSRSRKSFNSRSCSSRLGREELHQRGRSGSDSRSASHDFKNRSRSRIRSETSSRTGSEPEQWRARSRARSRTRCKTSRYKPRRSCSDRGRRRRSRSESSSRRRRGRNYSRRSRTRSSSKSRKRRQRRRSSFERSRTRSWSARTRSSRASRRHSYSSRRYSYSSLDEDSRSRSTSRSHSYRSRHRSSSSVFCRRRRRSSGTSRHRSSSYD